MAKRSYMDLSIISEKWLGVYLELFLKIRESSWKVVDSGLILDKNRGLFPEWCGIIGFELFSNGKWCGLSPRFVDHGRRRSTMDQG
jgi:hypothetical protein